MRISDWSSDVCSSDLVRWSLPNPQHAIRIARAPGQPSPAPALPPSRVDDPSIRSWRTQQSPNARMANPPHSFEHEPVERRSEEHTSELQSLMRISYAVFCLKKKKKKIQQTQHSNTENHHRRSNH